MGIERSARNTFRRYAYLYPGIYHQRGKRFSTIQRLRGGVHEPDFTRLRDLNVSDPMVIDVGANVGQTIVSVKSVLPHARMLSLEPSTSMIPTLLRTASRYRGVRVVPVGAGREFTTRVLRIPVLRGVTLDQYASVEAIDVAKLAAKLANIGFGRVRAEQITLREETCVLVPLDALIESCDVLKVDVEGHEAEVVEGARGLIERSRPIVIVERPTPALRGELTGIGYLELSSLGSVNTTFVHPEQPRGMEIPP